MYASHCILVRYSNNKHAEPQRLAFGNMKDHHEEKHYADRGTETINWNLEKTNTQFKAKHKSSHCELKPEIYIYKKKIKT